jgi:hypothetical protein
MPPGPSLVLIYATQRIELVAGVGEERDLTLELVVLSTGLAPVRLPRAVAGEVVRKLVQAERQATPDADLLRSLQIDVIEADVLSMIKKEAIVAGEGVNIMSIWPVACFVANVG